MDARPHQNPNNSLLPGVSPMSPPVNYLFLGNPGTGKSTLINCLAGTPVFDSGLSYGGGLTKEFQKRIHDNVQYMDTPGLADRNIQEKAAAAITEALQQSGVYKLFFMVRLENGRVVSDDLATIEIVLNSIEMNDIPFAVLVNNVKKRQYAELAKKGADYLKVVTVINSINHTTPHIAFIPVIDDLDEEDNAVAELPGDVESFIRFEAPTVPIVPQSVKSIEIQDFKEMSERLREAQNELLQDNAMLERRMAELREKSNPFRGFFNHVGDFFSSVTDCVLPSVGQQLARHGTVNHRGGGNSNVNVGLNNVQVVKDSCSMSHYGSAPASRGGYTQHPVMNAAAAPARIEGPKPIDAWTTTSTVTTSMTTTGGAAGVPADTEAQRQNKRQPVGSTTNQLIHETQTTCEDPFLVTGGIHQPSQQIRKLVHEEKARTGPCRYGSFSQPPAPKEAPQVGGPIQRNMPGKTAQKAAEPYLDGDGDEKMEAPYS